MATLEAVARVPRDHLPGFLGWSLYFQAPQSEAITLVMRGNDSQRRGVCYYHLPNHLWLPGTYALYACRFAPDNCVPLRHAHRVWILREPTSRIGCGTIREALPPLRL